MDLQALRYFVSIAEAGSFTEGARNAYIVQSSASAAIARLERELGSELFTRIGRRIEITEAGRLLLAHARAMLESSQDARDDIDALREGLIGAVTLGSIPGTGTPDLPDALVRFRRAAPLVRVDLRSSANHGDFGALLDGRFDLLLARMPPEPPADVCIHPVAHTRIVPVVGRDHPLASASAITLRDLAAYEQIDFPVGWSNRDIADAAFRANHVGRTVGVEVVDVTTALSFAAVGAGVAFVSEQFAASRANLSILDLELPLPPLRLGLGWTTRRPLSLPARGLREAFLGAAPRVPSAY